ncbi:hypothetical protein ACJDU8_07435 [Clostridium sp. WILCCON 0269]|uniref:Uncharacterized protein n=1 Tax=Candidatus Clostridium eludens TaxID=3381663 RepID=A0ABW8SJG9_9CLOT
MVGNRRYKGAKKVNRIAVAVFSILILVVAMRSLKSYMTTKLTTAAVAQNKHKNSNKRKTDDAIPKDVLNHKYKVSNYQNNDIRKFPYPYSSMLSLCSDIDDTTLKDFKTYHQFLNTTERTSHGEGLGLDVGDSMWLYMGDKYSKSTSQGHGSDDVMTYYKGIDINKKNNADEITKFIKCGWIDCIHTFGDFSTANEKGTYFTRELAVNGWKTLKDIGFSPKVWINHGNRANKQNFGAATTSSFMSYQQGDNPKSIYYHTDITIGNGIRYVWNSMNDNIFGQDYPLFEISLRDGRRVWGFYRYTNNISRGKIDWTWTPSEIHRQLTQSNLDKIVKNKQYSIVAQHLGVSTQDLFTKENIQALRLLKQYEDKKKILITKTSRLLDYADVYKYVMYNKSVENGITYIDILGVNDPLFGKSIPQLDDLRGLTFYTNDSKNTVILLNDNVINKNEIEVNPKDETGKESVSIKWYNPNYKDYSKQ